MPPARIHSVCASPKGRWERPSPDRMDAQSETNNKIRAGVFRRRTCPLARQILVLLFHEQPQVGTKSPMLHKTFPLFLFNTIIITQVATFPFVDVAV